MAFIAHYCLPPQSNIWLDPTEAAQLNISLVLPLCFPSGSFKLAFGLEQDRGLSVKRLVKAIEAKTCWLHVPAKLC